MSRKDRWEVEMSERYLYPCLFPQLFDSWEHIIENGDERDLYLQRSVGIDVIARKDDMVLGVEENMVRWKPENGWYDALCLATTMKNGDPGWIVKNAADVLIFTMDRKPLGCLHSHVVDARAVRDYYHVYKDQLHNGIDKKSKTGFVLINITSLSMVSDMKVYSIDKRSMAVSRLDAPTQDYHDEMMGRFPKLR